MCFSRFTPHKRGLSFTSCAVALLVIASGCGVRDASLATGPGRTIENGTENRPLALIGRWERIVIFTDAGGTVHASETLWDFRLDGTALRTVVTRNLSEGFADATTAVMLWSTRGSSLVLDFLSPASGTVQFFFHIDRDILTLDGRDFIRARP